MTAGTETQYSPIVYWIVLLAFFGANILIGYRAYIFQRKSKTDADEHHDFWLKGRSNDHWAVGMSIAAGWMLIGFMTWMAWSTYNYGISGIWIGVVPWTILLFIMVALVPLVRRLKAISQPQMLHNRFGLPIRILVCPMNMFCFLIWSAAELYAVSLILAPPLGIPVWAAIIIFTIPIAVYIGLGGFRAVINANILQFFMAILFTTALAVGSWIVARGIAADHHTTIWAMLSAQKLVNAGGYAVKPAATATSIMCFTTIAFPIVSILALLPGWTIEEDWWLKSQSAKDTKHARKAIWANLIYNVIWVLFAASFVGLMGLIIFPPILKGGALVANPALGPSGGYNVFSAFIQHYIPPWGVVILLPMLCAHSMSTVTTFTNVSSMNLSYDMLQPLYYRHKNFPEKKINLWSRFVSMGVVMFTVLLALLYTIPAVGATLNLGYFLSSGVLTAGVAVPVYAIFWKRANLQGVMVGSTAGCLATIIFFILEYKVWNFSYTFPVFDWIFGKGAMAGTFLGYCIVGLIFGVSGLIVGTYLAPVPAQELLDAVAAAPVDDHAEFFEGVAKTSFLGDRE